MALKAGELLYHGRYRVVELIGSGGFGAVYKATAEYMGGHLVAIKENTLITPQAREQFEREARLLFQLKHNYLPRVTDYFDETGKGQFMVMDFVEGPSLQDLLERRGGPLNEDEVLLWMRQICEALEYLHTLKPPIIHRDVKPANIILTKEGYVMLVDFGIAKTTGPGQLTIAGARGVTRGYSPPEQYGGQGATSARSDVYSLGATLYTLLTGNVPPEGTALSSGTETLMPPHEKNPLISEATSQVIVAAMNPIIGRRPASAALLASRLPVRSLPPSPAHMSDSGVNASVESTIDNEKTLVALPASPQYADDDQGLPADPLLQLAQHEPVPTPSLQDDPPDDQRKRVPLWSHPRVVIPATVFVLILGLWAISALWATDVDVTLTPNGSTETALPIVEIVDETDEPLVNVTSLSPTALTPSAPTLISMFTPTDSLGTITEETMASPTFTATTTASPSATFTATPSPTLSQTPTLVGQVNVAALRSVYTRQGPGLEYPIDGGLVKGQVVPVLRRDAGALWYLVEIGANHQVWVSANFVVAQSDGVITNIPIAEIIPTPPVPTATPTTTPTTTPTIVSGRPPGDPRPITPTVTIPCTGPYCGPP